MQQDRRSTQLTSHLQSSSLPPRDYAIHPKIGWNPVDPASEYRRYQGRQRRNDATCIHTTTTGTLKWKSGKRGELNPYYVLSPTFIPGSPETPDPSNQVAHFKGLVLLYTPSKSGREMTDLRAQLAAAIDKQASAFQQCKRRLSDAQNEARNPRKRAPCARNHRADQEERAHIDSPFDTKELEECVRRHGCKFVILCGLWLALDDCRSSG
ncbi:hypothetical protein DFH08DRAFT_975910 [Mycena albidolilacea]|uniref:Uncharacterized protein n=1 Tax=Mycena albidolilacea TaxID=1033008 RepID=A0AAD6Z4T0_9AGAR|nr:hypothetical protein DFH08DRAFT_975910 [Mycena albidolilacea]